MIEFSDDRPPRADALRNHRLLLDTARRLFHEQGVQNVSMSAIAETAQVGKGTLYRHFADKAAVCMALLDEDMRDLQMHSFSLLAQPYSPAEKLYAFLQAVVNYVISHLEFLCESAQHESGNFLQHPAHLWWWQTSYSLLVQAGLTPEQAHAHATALYAFCDVNSIRLQQQHFGKSEQAILRDLEILLNQWVGSGR